jgi:2',3'-cyclic-nucleotide 2'-phosphodiesterase
LKILYFGDVFARPGREAVKYAIQKLVPAHQIDFVIINGENVAHGQGILPEMAEDFFAGGVDIITTGNHVWDQKQIIPFIEKEPRLLRPANYPDDIEMPAPGKGTFVANNKRRAGPKLGVIHVMGRIFMDSIDCPFRTAEAEYEEMKRQGVKHIFCDFHGEASSEKQAFAHFMDGKASAVVGSHSHVQTADERVLPGGTAAITDVGMSGCYDSVIGVKKEVSIQRFMTKRPVRFEPAEGPGGYGCVIIDLDDSTGRAKSILRLREEKVV